MAKRARIGDIVEIPTARGLTYAQVSHKHSRYGHLLRILPGFFESRPADLDKIAWRKHSFVTFFPLDAAIRQEIFSIVGNVPVPEHSKQFPLFRTGMRDPRTGKVATWWLWDGESEWPIGALTMDQHSLPIRGIWNDTILIERIEKGWTPEQEI